MANFEKGGTRSADAGRKLGTPNAATSRKDRLRASFELIEDKIFEYAETLEPSKAAKFYLELKEYFDPKLSRAVVEATVVKREDHSGLSIDTLKATIQAIKECQE